MTKHVTRRAFFVDNGASRKDFAMYRDRDAGSPELSTWRNGTLVVLFDRESLK